MPKIVACLAESGLVITHADASISATAVGSVVREARLQGDFRPFVLALLRTVPAQVEALIAHAQRDTTGLSVPAPFARKRAPQAAGLIQWLGDEYVKSGNLVLPEEVIVETLNTDRRPEMPSWVEDRLAVGARAEQYTLVFERSHAAPKAVLHVAAESDRYGYDVENASGPETRCVEVKGSRGATLRFELSAHELRVAEGLGARYEIQFWGGIDLTRPMAEEYPLLIDEGYPIRLLDPAALIRAGDLSAEPASWRVTGSPVAPA
jgi:hypothetical protein